MKVFESDSDYETYLTLLAECAKDAGIVIWCYCLMPNHVHIVAVPIHARSLAAGLGRAHQRYSLRFNRRHDWCGHLWQERFFSVPMDLHHAMAAMRYALFNPVRAGLVSKAEDWPYSSARAHLGLDQRSSLETAVPARQIDDWSGFLKEPASNSESEAVRRNTRSGFPLGDWEFVAELERRTGRRLRPKPGGRPTKDPSG